MYERGKQKSSYDDIISAADFFYQWDTSITTPMEEMCGP